MAFIPSGFGGFLQKAGQDLSSYPELKYQREQDALKWALENRKVDSAQENNALRQALALFTQQQTNQDRDDARALSVFNSMPSQKGGSLIPPGLEDAAKRLISPSLLQQQQLPQLASTAIGGATETPEYGSVPAGISATESNPAKPAGLYFEGNRMAQLGQGNLDARNENMRFQQGATNRRLDQADTRIDLSQGNLDERKRMNNWTMAHPGIGYQMGMDGTVYSAPTRANTGVPVAPVTVGGSPGGGNRPVSATPTPAPRPVVNDAPNQAKTPAAPGQTSPQATPPPAKANGPINASELYFDEKKWEAPEMQQEVLKRPLPGSAQLRGEMMKLQPIIRYIEDLKRISPQVNRASDGLISRGLQTGFNALETVGQTGPSAEMDMMNKAYGAMLARMAGEVGVLTDPDIQRAGAWQPNYSDVSSFAQTKIRHLENMVRDRMSFFQKYGIWPGQYEQQQKQRQQMVQQPGVLRFPQLADPNGMATDPAGLR